MVVGWNAAGPARCAFPAPFYLNMRFAGWLQFPVSCTPASLHLVCELPFGSPAGAALALALSEALKGADYCSGEPCCEPASTRISAAVNYFRCLERRPIVGVSERR